MKVEILRSVAGANFSYSRGVADVPDGVAKDLIRAGHAKTHTKPRQKIETAATETSEKMATQTGKRKGRTKPIGGEK